MEPWTAELTIVYYDDLLEVGVVSGSSIVKTHFSALASMLSVGSQD